MSSQRKMMLRMISSFGILVKRETTSKETRMWSSGIVVSLMNFANEKLSTILYWLVKVR